MGEGGNHTNANKQHYMLPKLILISFLGLLQADNQDVAIQECVVCLLAALSTFISFSYSLLGPSSDYLHWKVNLG